jgi:hypothetical protein
VRDHIAKLDGVLDAVVYGVKLARYVHSFSPTFQILRIKSYDGQAGAAALTLDIPEALFMKDLYSGLKKTGLPSYAMPRLVRITKEYVFFPSLPSLPKQSRLTQHRIEANATFKKSKNDLIKKSWRQSEAGTDSLYWLDGQVYRPLDLGAWSGIESGRAKL